MPTGPGDGTVKEVNYRVCIKLSNGSYEIAEKTVVMTKEQIEALIDDIESQLATLEDMGQDLWLNLQDAMNVQQQLMQMMANIMKNIHNTAKAIIRNMK